MVKDICLIWREMDSNCSEKLIARSPKAIGLNAIVAIMSHHIFMVKDICLIWQEMDSNCSGQLIARSPKAIVLNAVVAIMSHHIFISFHTIFSLVSRSITETIYDLDLK